MAYFNTATYANLKCFFTQQASRLANQVVGQVLDLAVDHQDIPQCDLLMSRVGNLRVSQVANPVYCLVLNQAVVLVASRLVSQVEDLAVDHQDIPQCDLLMSRVGNLRVSQVANQLLFLVPSLPENLHRSLQVNLAVVLFFVFRFLLVIQVQLQSIM